MVAFMPPTHALVDIGNVLLAFDFEPALRRLVAVEAPNPDERILSLIDKKDDFESGKISEDAFIAWASERLGFTGTPNQFRAEWNSIFTPITAMWSSMHDLKNRGLTLILLSNTNAIHARTFLPDYEVFSLFDHAVFSHLVRAIKPDPIIFEHAIETYSLDPTHTLYLDDMPENIAAGEKLGFLSHQYDYRDHKAYTHWLASL